MWSIKVLLLFLCGSLVVARNDEVHHIEQKIDIFGPLNEKVYPLLFTDIRSYYEDLVDKLSKLDFAEKKRLSAEYKHTYGTIHIPDVKLRKDPRIPENDYLRINLRFKDFNKKINRDKNRMSDWSILLNRSIEYNQKAHSLRNASTNSYNKYEYIKFNSFIRRALLDNTFWPVLNIMTYHLDEPYLQIILQQSVCHRRMSLQQMLGNIRGHVALAKVQALLSQWLSLDMMDLINDEQNKPTGMLAKDVGKWHSDANIKRLFEYLKHSMVNASREVWRCDPTNHIHDITYTKLERAFQDFSSEERAAKCDISYQPICHNISDTSDRYFDLQPVFSNVYNNSVITGLRLIKRNHIVRIQIQEGQLLSNGMIDKASITWVPIKDYTSCENCFVLSSGSRTVDLDDVVLPDPNSLLTGISFEKIKKTDGDENLSLIVYSTPFNFTTGKLNISDDSLPWKAVYPKPKKTSEYDDKSSSDSLFYGLTPSSRIDQLKFNSKTLKTGETVITPYIDMQPITTIPATPMSGAGLIYRNETNEFLALKLFTLDITPFLMENDNSILRHV